MGFHVTPPTFQLEQLQLVCLVLMYFLLESVFYHFNPHTFIITNRKYTDDKYTDRPHFIHDIHCSNLK